MEPPAVPSPTHSDVTLEKQSPRNPEPDKRRAREPGDASIFIGLGVGTVAGASLVFLGGVEFGCNWSFIGMLVGGYVGTLVGVRHKEEQRRKLRLRG